MQSIVTRKSQCALLALQVFLCACSHGGLRSNATATVQIPADWRRANVDRVTIYLPPNAKETATSEPKPDSKRFETERLSISIARSKADSTALELVSNGESKKNEEAVLIDGRSSLVTKFRIQFPSGRDYVAVAIIPDVYASEPRNIIMWAQGQGPEEQELARKIFFTARVSP